MYLYPGYLLLAMTIGGILGLSNTPVAGVFITALFGLIATVVGSQYLFDKSNSTTVNQKSIGIGMSIVSVGLIIGIFLGEGYRNSAPVISDTEKTALPWEGLETPKNTYEALDWIQVKEKLLSLGYDPSDVKKIYKIRVAERSALKQKIQKEQEEESELYERTKLYDSRTPFHTVISEKQPSSKGRGLASLNEK